jgi:Protein kinase domain
MRLCPACGNQYPDDANFCPMDATRLPPPPAAATPEITLRDQPKPIGGRFLLAGPEIASPTGVMSLATDANGGAQVMLKIVTPAALPTPPMADRALRELKQLGKVTSERVVKVLDQGKTDDGRVYVATEVVEARSLEELVAQEGPLPLPRAVAIVLQVGEALTEAQKVGVIHRDVSPRNVLVGGGDKVKVADFGLAEPVTDKVFGAPAYLSPEQVEGRPVDQRSNIYSLGAVLYYAVTGAAPFSGDPQSLLQQQLSATPQPPSARTQGLPAELDKVVLKALEKSGGRRHLTLRQLLTELEAATGVKAGDAAKHAAAAPAARPMAATVMGLPAMGSPKAPSEARTMMMQPAPEAAPAPAPTVQAPAPTVQAPAPTVQAPAPVVQAPTVQAPAPAVHTPAPTVPQPVVPAAKPASAPAGKKPAAAGGGGFRETAWFKQGEIEEEIAKRQAQAASEDPLAPTGTTGQHVAVDASAVTREDHNRLSLKTGSTQAMPVIKGGNASGKKVALPGEQMDEAEMLAEIDSSKKWFLVAGVAVLVVVLAAILYFTVFRSAPSAEAPPPPKPAAVAAAPPAAPAPAAPAPPPAAPAPPVAPAPTTKTPAQLLAEADAEMRNDDLGAAVDDYQKAAEAGGDAKALKKLDAALTKALAAKAKTAKKRKDKAGEADVRALLAKLHKKK